MKHFFIATMPRAGSAWLANLLSSGNAFAHHEVLRQTYRRGEMQPSWIGGYEVEGAVGCDLALWPKVIYGGPLVVVDRDADESYRSAVEITADYRGCRALADECDRALEKLVQEADLVVKFEDLFKVDTIIDIAGVVGVKLDPMRVKQLLGMKIAADVLGFRYHGSPQFQEKLAERLNLTALGSEVES